MKVRSQEDVEKLDLRIKSELGVDVQKYRNDEVVENIVAILIFPEYVLTWIIGPILLAIAAFVVGFFFLDLAHVEYALYGIIGLVLFLITGICLGYLVLTKRMKKDVWGIVDHSLSMMKALMQDASQVRESMPKEKKKESTIMLFQGVIHLVTIPTMTTVIEEKIPILGILIAKFIKKVLTMIANGIDFSSAEMESLSASSAGPHGNMETQSLSSIGSFKRVKKVIDVTFGIARFPAKLIFVIFAAMLLLFLWIIN